jgi:hypothetical protein
MRKNFTLAIAVTLALILSGCGAAIQVGAEMIDSAPQEVEEDSAAADTESSSLTGKWGSYSWMGDGVGAFLIVKSLGGSDYSGIFYTQGQSGGVYKDSEIYLTDMGDGLAEVQWPSGNATIATWGKRDANTSSDMLDSWNGDIWFDCIGELDFAQSRADCNFYLSD